MLCCPVQVVASVWFKGWSQDYHSRQAIESAGPKPGVERALSRIEQKRVDEKFPSITFDFVTAEIAMKVPALPPCGATTGHPVNKNEIGVRVETELLPLFVTRFREALNRVRHENKQRFPGHLRAEFVRTRQVRGVAIHLRRSLGAEKTPGFRIDAQFEPRAIARDESSAETAGVGPNRVAP